MNRAELTALSMETLPYRDHFVSTDAERMLADIRAIGGPRHRAIPGSMDRAREYCRSVLTTAGWTVTDQEFHPTAGLRISDHGRPGSPLPIRWTSDLHGINMIATRGGEPKPGDTLVIAHLDTVLTSPGADDNGSGVAVILELARWTADRAKNVVLALVDFEETGHLGAKHLARTLPRPGLVICLDSVGVYNDAPGSQKVPAGLGAVDRKAVAKIKELGNRGNFLLVVHRGNSADIAKTFADNALQERLLTIRVHDRRPNPTHGQAFTRQLYPLHFDLDRSDHEPFWRRGIPTLFLSATAPLRNPEYHRAGDTIDKLDPVRLGKVKQALAMTLLGEHASIPEG